MIDLKELQLSLSNEYIIELVSELGSDEYKETDDAIIFKTICHNHSCDDASLKLYYYKKNKMFHCYTECGCNFNIYELFKKRYELLGISYNFYKDIVLKVAQHSKVNEIENGFYDVYKSELERYKPYSVELGIRGRALNEEDIAIGKYMPVQIGDKIYSHPLGYNLYGLNLNKENIKKRKIAIVFESEKSVLLYETLFGRENNIAVATCGSNFSLYQFKLLKEAGAERIIIAFDKEGENWKEKEKYREKLAKLCKRYSNECLMGFITDTKNLIRLKDSPIDRGEKIFKQLCKEGVVWI